VPLDRPAADVAPVLARLLALGDRLDRWKEHDKVAGTAADHRPVLVEQRAADHVLEGDIEAGFEVRVGRGGGKPIAKSQLLERRPGHVGPGFLSPADDEPAKDVALEMHTALEARRKQARHRRLSGRHRSGDEVHGRPVQHGLGFAS
jgi:hypothetical protein